MPQGKNKALISSVKNVDDKSREIRAKGEAKKYLLEYGINLSKTWTYASRQCFQWDEENYDIEHVKEELADVLVYCQNLLDKLNLDEDEIVNEKMTRNEQKYPVEKSKGRADKYNKL